MKKKRILTMLCVAALLGCLFCTSAYAAGTGDVAGAVESTWKTASTQIKSIVNKMVFLAIDLILAKTGCCPMQTTLPLFFKWGHHLRPGVCCGGTGRP